MKTRSISALLFIAFAVSAHALDLSLSLRNLDGDCSSIQGVDRRGKPIKGVMKIENHYGYGGKEIGECRDGKLDGTLNVYYGEDALELEIPFKNGKIDGIEKGYYESGILKQETPYKNGKKEGERKIYRENGKPLGIIVYKNDKPVSVACHHKINGYETRSVKIERLDNMKFWLEIICE